MPGIDPSKEFIPVQIAILTVSSTRSLGDDPSGDYLVAAAEEAGHKVLDRALVTDSSDAIVEQVKAWRDNPKIDVVIATGGTGLTGSDSTPEAFESLYEKSIPGFGELFRWLSFKIIGTSTIQSRATAGVAKGTYLFALPGSTSACRDAWTQILVHQLDARYRPCNFVDIMPRLREASGTRGSSSN